MIRFEFDGRIEEKGGQQFASGRGAYGDAWTRIHRPEAHGFASRPPAGSKGILLPRPGTPDFAILIGGEHPSMRPPDLPDGGTAFYDSSGNIMKMMGGGGLTIDVPGRTITATCGTWKIVGNFELVGNMTVSGNISAGGTITDSDGNNGA